MGAGGVSEVMKRVRLSAPPKQTLDGRLVGVSILRSSLPSGSKRNTPRPRGEATQRKPSTSIAEPSASPISRSNSTNTRRLLIAPVARSKSWT